MNAEIVAIGDELTSGQRLDTNSRWLSQQLGEIGITVTHHTTVGDDLTRLIEAFEIAGRRADVVVASGGLGPTADDLTREAIAAAMGVELVLDAECLAHIQGLFARRGRSMPERNQRQALLPRGARAIPNPEGTAPGVDATWVQAGHTCRILALPGVPAELFQMWDQTVRPRLTAGRPMRIVQHRVIKCFGAGESQIEAMLPDLIARGRVPSVGITAHEATITLRISAVGQSVDECQQLIGPTEDTIRQTLGGLVYGEEDDELEQVVLRMMADRGLRLSTLEWATEGLVAERLGWVTGSERVYRGGLVVRDSEALGMVLDAGSLSQTRPDDDADFTRELARLWHLRTRADVAVSVGPLRRATPGLSETDWFSVAVSGPNGLFVDRHDYGGHSAIRRPRAAKQVLNSLRLRLLELGGQSR